MAKVLGIEKEKAVEIVKARFECSKRRKGQRVPRDGPTAGDPGSDPVDRMEGVGEKTAEMLEANGFQTVQDILETDMEKLSALPGIGIKKQKN